MAAGPPTLTVVCLLATAVAALLLAASSASPAAAAGNHGGGRMAIIIRATGTSRIAAAVPSGARSKWRQHDGRRRRLVEDEVAPEFGGLLGAGGISTDPLIKDRAACTSNCAGKGEPYTRPCIYKNQCNG